VVTDSTTNKISGLAAGDIASGSSTEAVNGGQLFAQGEGVKNIIGGTTTYDPSTGTYTNADIGGTGKGNINDAIKAAKTEVAAGTNVADVTKTEGSDGQSVYTVNAKGTTASAGSTAVTVSSVPTKAATLPTMQSTCRKPPKIHCLKPIMPFNMMTQAKPA
jgi:hypothetical protein